MTMPPRLGKLALTLHVTASGGLLGAIAAFLALAVTGLISQDTQMTSTAYPAMQSVARFVLVPLAFASLLTGLIQSLGTPWGLIRHHWVLLKLLLTVFAATVLLLKIELIDYAAHLATETALPHAVLREAGIQLVVHAVGGLLVLLVTVVLSIYKPTGTTRYGPGTNGGREVLCEILKCLGAKGVIDERLIRRLEALGIDVRQLWRCLAQLCHSADKPHPGDTIR